jgi:hypothetical protein
MRRLVLLFTILVVTITADAQKHHCLFIGTVNIDRTFPYWHTPRGKILLTYIEKNHDKSSAIEFNNNLQILIKKYYLNHLALYIRNRRFNKIFYTFN